MPLRFALVLALFLTIIGCAREGESGLTVSPASSFGTIPASPTFLYQYPARSVQDSSYRVDITKGFERIGWTETDKPDAQYRVSYAWMAQGGEQPSTLPVFGDENSETATPADSYGPNAELFAGSMTLAKAMSRYELSMSVTDATGRHVFEGTVWKRAAPNSWPQVMPELISKLLAQFPARGSAN